MPLRARNDIHLARRLWHFFGVMFIFLLYWLVPPEKAGLTAVLITAPVLAFDVARFYIPSLNRTLTSLFKPFMREAERTHFAGLTYLLVGVTIVIFIFPRSVVYLALLFVGIADPLASFFGIRYGRDKLIGEKSLQGSMAAFITCFLLSLGYFCVMGMLRERLFIVCLLSGLIGAVSELLPLAKLDDNFVFPVMSSALLTGMYYVFGGL